MKKLLSALTAAAVIMLTGCSSIDTVETPHTTGREYDTSPAPAGVTEVTLGIATANLFIDSCINKFNAENDSFKIIAKDYVDHDGTLIDMQNSLKMDIVSGRMPDILLCDDSALYKILSTKGAFSDISALCDDIGVLPNVRNVCTEDDGGIYRLPLGISVKTACTPASNGTDCCEIYDYKTMQRVMESLGGNELLSLDTMAPEDSTRHSLICDFTDLRAHTCNFDTPEFIEALEFYKTVKQGRHADTANTAGRMVYADLCSVSFLDYYAHKCYAGTEVVFTPPEHARLDCKSCLTVSTSAKDEVRRGAEEFIRFVMADENVDTHTPTYFPMTESGLDIALRLPISGIDDDGNKVSYTLSDEDIDHFRSYITSVRQENYCDVQVMYIFQEETEAYINGAHTAEECAAYIQNRASLYLSEQS